MLIRGIRTQRLLARALGLRFDRRGIGPGRFQFILEEPHFGVFGGVFRTRQIQCALQGDDPLLRRGQHASGRRD